LQQKFTRLPVGNPGISKILVPMNKTDKLLFLLSILLLCLFASLGQGSTPLSETRVMSVAPSVQVKDIDLNTADAEALCRLPGVGPVIAERIIAQREALGGFSCIEELQTVKGIGDKTMEKIYAYMEE